MRNRKENQMNQLHVRNEEVSLEGFDEITDNAYFVFRQSGLVVSGKKLESLHKQYHFALKDHMFTDLQFAKKLLQYGFDEMHSFVYSNGEYYCIYPCL